MGKLRIGLGIILIKSSNSFYRLARFLCLTLLKPDDLQELTRFCYRQRGCLSNRRDYSKHSAELDPAERMFCEKYLLPRSRVLVIGCGSGRESIALARMGHEVTGIDFVAEYVESARRNAAAERLTATFITMSVDELANLSCNAFSAVMFSGLLYSLIPSSKKRVQALKGAGRQLDSEGKVFLSFLPRCACVDTRYRAKLMAARLSAGNTEIKPGDFVEGDGEFKHYFSESEIRSEAELAGLSVHQLQIRGLNDSFAVLA